MKTNEQIFNDTQKQLQLQEKLETALNNLVERIDLIEATTIRIILDNDFGAAECILERLSKAYEILGVY